MYIASGRAESRDLNGISSSFSFSLCSGLIFTFLFLPLNGLAEGGRERVVWLQRAPFRYLCLRELPPGKERSLSHDLCKKSHGRNKISSAWVTVSPAGLISMARVADYSDLQPHQNHMEQEEAISQRKKWDLL